jgi:uncharacterized membrane protein
MDQERADYDDAPGRGRRPWSLLQVAILIAIVLLSLPLAAVAGVVAAIIFSGGMQD